MFKLCFAVAATIVLFSVQIHSKSIQDGEDVRDLLEQLKTVANQSIQDAIPILNGIVSDVKESSASTHNKTEDRMKSIQKGFKEALEYLNDNAEEGIEECFEGIDEKLDDIFNKLFEYFVDKEVEFRGQGILYAVATLDKIEQFSDKEITAVEQEITDCEGSTSKDCSDVAARIDEDIISLPKKIVADVDDAKDTAKNFLSTIEDFGLEAETKFDTEGGEVLASVVECVGIKATE